MKPRSIYVLFGRTNPYQARTSGLFRGRTHIATHSQYMDRDEASRFMVGHCLSESDNYSISDDENHVIDCLGNEIMATDGVSYHHDGYTWEIISVEEMNEEEARIAIRDRQVWDGFGLEELQYRFPDLIEE